MDRKYQINYASTLVKMAFGIKNLKDGSTQQVIAEVDLSNNDVKFTYPPMEGVDKASPEDCDSLKEEILDFLRPKQLDGYSMPPELLQRIADVKSGNWNIPDTGGFE